MRCALPMAVAFLFLCEVPTRSDALNEWEVLNPPVTSSTLTAATCAEGRFLAVCAQPRVLDSGTNGAWTTHPVPTPNALYGITYGHGIFVAVGDWGTVLVSSGGTLWTNVTSATQNHLYAVTHAQDLFVAVGTNGTIMTSSNALNWTLQTSGTSNQLSEVAFGADAFVAVGKSGTIQRSVDGITWTPVQNSESNALASVTYGGGQFVAVGEAGVILQSADGLQWSRQNFVTNSLNAVTYGNDTFVAVGEGGTIVTSPDGISWIRPDSGIFSPLYTVVYGNGCFLAGGTFGAIVTSLNGSSWDIRNLSGTYYGIAFNEDTVVAVGSFGKILTSTTRGESWIYRNAGQAGNLNAIKYGNGMFVAVGNNGLVVTSVDGLGWIQRPVNTSERLRGITFANDRFIAVGRGGVIVSSHDGATWTHHDIWTTAALEDIAYGDGLYVIAALNGFSEAIITSPDATNWTIRSSILTCGCYNLRPMGVAYGNGRFVVAGSAASAGGAPHATAYSTVSQDGTNWFSVYGGGALFWRIAFGNGIFIATETDELRVSPEAGERGFYRVYVPGAPNPQNVGFHENRVYVVGGQGGIARSASLLVSLRGRTLSQAAGFELTASGGLDGVYRLQASTSFGTWTDLLTFTNNHNQPSTSFVDSAATNYAQRFYRIVSP